MISIQSWQTALTIIVHCPDYPLPYVFPDPTPLLPFLLWTFSPMPISLQHCAVENIVDLFSPTLQHRVVS